VTTVSAALRVAVVAVVVALSRETKTRQNGEAAGR
jgi:hypothetical protein